MIQFAGQVSMDTKFSSSQISIKRLGIARA
jgi:hypothetical protein